MRIARMVGTSSRLRSGSALILLSLLLMGAPQPAAAVTQEKDLVTCLDDVDARYEECIEGKTAWGRTLCKIGRFLDQVACLVDLIEGTID